MSADLVGAFFAGVFGVLGLQTVMAVLGGLWWHARRRATPAPKTRYTFAMPTYDANPPEPTRRIPDH